MAFDLILEFGGLAMFVPSPSQQKLFVLMPRMRDPNMEHFVYMQYDRQYASTPGNGLEAAQLKDYTLLDFTEFPVPGTVTVPAPYAMPKELLPISELGGREKDGKWEKRPVNPALLSGNPSGKLIARIELPYGLDVTPVGERATLAIKYGGSDHMGDYTGLASVRMRSPDSNISILKLFGLTPRVTSDSDGSVPCVKLWLANVMYDQLTHCRGKHGAGEPLPHVPAYYDLLRGGRVAEDPTPQCGKDVEGNCMMNHGTMGGAHRMEHHHKDSRPMMRDEMRDLRFIDPYNCTVGSGCEDGHCT